MKLLPLAFIVFGVLSVAGCSSSADAESGPPGEGASAAIKGTRISKVKSLTNAELKGVSAKFEAGAPSFPSDGYTSRSLGYVGDEAGLLKALGTFNPHLSSAAEISTTAVKTENQAKDLVNTILAHLELDDAFAGASPAKDALAAALLASLWVKSSVALRVYKGVDSDDDHRLIYLSDPARHEILELNEGS